MAPDPSASVDASAEPEPDTRQAVSFAIVRRGYDQRQVDDVLDDMAGQITALQSATAELREREADLLAALDAAEYRARRAEAATEDLEAAAASAEAATPASEEATAAVGPIDTGPPLTADAATVDATAGPAGATDVATMVGEETARIVDAARHAAVEIGARARDDAQRIVADAREEARSIRADAETQLLHRTREADDAVAARLLEAADAVQQAQDRAEQIVADAFTEAATVVLRAREEADALVAEGERSARALTEAAEGARDDLLVDLIRRRKLLRGQVEQLEAGRVRLRSAYTVVEDALHDATAELDGSVEEARDAALAAVERSDARPDPEVAAVATELGADAAALVARAHPDRSSARVSGADRPEDDATSVDAPAPSGADDLDPNRRTGGDDRPEAPADDPTAADPAPVAADAEIEPRSTAPDPPAEPAATSEAVAEAVVEADATPAPTPRATADDTPTPATSARRRRRAPDPVEFEGRWSSAVRVLPPGPDLADADRAAGQPVREPVSASEVFARLRSGSDHQPSLFDAAGPSDPNATGDADPAAAEADARGRPDPEPDLEPDLEPDPEHVWLERRDVALAPALRALRRRLKATLADDEDSLLEAVRRSDSLPDSVAAVRDAAVRRDDLAGALVASLVTAAAAGAELVAGSPAAVTEPAPVAVDTIALELADVVVGPLDERLERCVIRYHKAIAEAGTDLGADAADQGLASAAAARDAAMATLVSSVKAAYRARRGVQVQVPTEHAILLAGHGGLVAALEPGTPLRWVVAAPAPAARRRGSGAVDDPAGEPRVCTSCVAVADVGAGDPFGHGPLLPPARPGCRCGVAPVSAVVPRP